MSFYSELLGLAEAEGFPAAGGVDLDLALSDPMFQSHLKHYDEWLARGYQGEMSYLSRGRDRRADPRLLFPDAESVFCVLMPYDVHPAPSASSQLPQSPRFARYLGSPGQSEDYHSVMTDRLNRICQQMKDRLSSAEGGAQETLSWKVCVDTSAVLERTWAVLCGLGWIGKNSLLIHPKLGSFLFIGVIFLNRQLGRSPEILPNFCGNCKRCISGCPTSAIRSEKDGEFLDSNICISYLTLERRGPQIQDPTLRGQVGSWVAGCDLCQEVCPFNHKRLRSKIPNQSAAREPSSVDHWKMLLREEQTLYSARVKRSALSRIKAAQFKRNCALALSNLASGFELWELEELLGVIQETRPISSEESLKHEWLSLESSFRTQIAFHKERQGLRQHL